MSGYLQINITHAAHPVNLTCIKDTSYATGKKLMDILACNSGYKPLLDFEKIVY